jgi:Uma2 family endonuclease
MSTISELSNSRGAKAISVGPAPIPPLENGDRLTRAEFLRRWEAMPELQRAELIEGIVFMGAAAVRHRQHGRPYRIIIGWLDHYITETPGIDGGGNSSIGLDERNDAQPDGYLFLPAQLGSKLTVTAEGYLEGPPELVVEVSASTTSLDLNLKFESYRRNGVREYVVWRVLDKAVDWFVLDEGEYVPAIPDAAGVLRSRTFPGLWLDTTALVRQDAKQLHDVLRQGLASPEHQQFAALVAQYARPEE